MTFDKIKLIFFCLKETVSLMKNDKFDRTKSNAKGELNKRVFSLQQIRNY